MPNTSEANVAATGRAWNEDHVKESQRNTRCDRNRRTGQRRRVPSPRPVASSPAKKFVNELANYWQKRANLEELENTAR